MLVTTEGIVLHFIKYGESSVITTIYTRDFGRQSYLINAARSKKSKNKAGLLQHLFLVNLVAYQKQNRELHRIKEIKSNHAYQNIAFDITKSTQAIFIAEILYKTISEQESYPEMFEFMQNAFLYFDLMDHGSTNFHLFFLFRLTEYLGFLPNTEKVGFEGWFDMKKGSIVPFQPPHPFYANKDVTEYLIWLSSLRINQLGEFKISAAMRESLLTVLLDYYQLHFESLSDIKSLSVLKEVFQ
jgi:DNA repair protein RecO (recombination protein O)